MERKGERSREDTERDTKKDRETLMKRDIKEKKGGRRIARARDIDTHRDKEIERITERDP